MKLTPPTIPIHLQPGRAPSEPWRAALDSPTHAAPDAPFTEELDQARLAAQKLVANALVIPLLDAVREQPLDANLFHGGLAEDAFQQRLDVILADRIVQSSRFPLVDRIYQYIVGAQRNTQPRPESTGESAATAKELNVYG